MASFDGAHRAGLLSAEGSQQLPGALLRGASDTLGDSHAAEGDVSRGPSRELGGSSPGREAPGAATLRKQSAELGSSVSLVTGGSQEGGSPSGGPSPANKSVGRPLERASSQLGGPPQSKTSLPKISMPLPAAGETASGTEASDAATAAPSAAAAAAADTTRAITAAAAAGGGGAVSDRLRAARSRLSIVPEETPPPVSRSTSSLGVPMSPSAAQQQQQEHQQQQQQQQQSARKTRKAINYNTLTVLERHSRIVGPLCGPRGIPLSLLLQQHQQQQEMLLLLLLLLCLSGCVPISFLLPQGAAYELAID
ncbi:hypothetical protein ACSSS7_003933 [Eimeria intestinalis]